MGVYIFFFFLWTAWLENNYTFNITTVGKIQLFSNMPGMNTEIVVMREKQEPRAVLQSIYEPLKGLLQMLAIIYQFYWFCSIQILNLVKLQNMDTLPHKYKENTS